MTARSPGVASTVPAGPSRPIWLIVRNSPRDVLPRLASKMVLPCAALALVVSAELPREASWFVALLLVIVLGVPHGALDGEVVAPLLRPRFGRLWFLAFSGPYLALTALVLLAWQVAPLTTLAGFLTISVLHFGVEDAGPGRPWEALVRGGLPIVLPALLQPEATATIFAAVARVPLPSLPEWWLGASWLWLAAAAAWLVVRRPQSPLVIEMAGLACAFWLLPPLSAFALYFVCLHAPRHMQALVVHPTKAAHLDTMGRACLWSLPIFALTLVIGASLWPFYAVGTATPVTALLALTLQMLSALTLPHLLLDRWVERRIAQA